MNGMCVQCSEVGLAPSCKLGLGCVRVRVKGGRVISIPHETLEQPRSRVSKWQYAFRRKLLAESSCDEAPDLAYRVWSSIKTGGYHQRPASACRSIPGDLQIQCPSTSVRCSTLHGTRLQHCVSRRQAGYMNHLTHSHMSSHTYPPPSSFSCLQAPLRRVHACVPPPTHRTCFQHAPRLAVLVDLLFAYSHDPPLREPEQSASSVS